METIDRIPLIATPAGHVLFHGRWKAHFTNPVKRPKTGTIYGFDEWDDEWTNLVVDVGINDALDVHLSNGTQDSTWFVGLADGTPTVAAGDSMSSHAGWAEVTAYDEAARQAWVDGGVSSESVSNAGSPATFTISSDSTTIGGSFLSADSTKSGSVGILYAVGAFSSGDVTLNETATIDITAAFDAQDDGA